MRIFNFLLIALAPLSLAAQSIGNYSTLRTTGVSYSSINSSSNAVSSWRNNSGSFQQDDNRSNFVDIGFDFWYNGTRYTQFCVSTNGFIDFSTSTDNGDATADDFGYANSSFSSSNTTLSTNPALAPFYDDLTAQGATLPLGSSIRYVLSGSAPNRMLTVEWINMAVYSNTTPSLNFQVKLYESTGVIEYCYGTMNTGTFSFTYTCGINAATISGPPSVTQLKNQTTANSNTFSNVPQNGLVTLPAANSMISFTPPVPLNPAGTLTFTGVTQSGMTLNFSNWATNEVGYVIYNSTDGVNYSYYTQTAANATSANATGLIPGTTYFWRVYAVTEGALSTALSGTQATNAAGNKVSNMASGSWNNPLSWLPVGVPTVNDNVTILNGHTITVNANMSCNNLTVGGGTSGTLRIGDNATARTLIVNGNIIVNNGGNFSVNTASNITHTMTVSGDITNNGTFNMRPDNNSLCNLTFNKNGTQTISGAGVTTNVNNVVMNLGTSQSNLINVTVSNFTAPSAFLTFTNGTFRLASTNTTTINLFTTNATIGQSCGFSLANPNATINVQGDLTLSGKLEIDAGTVSIGSGPDGVLTSTGGTLIVDGGILNVTGRYVSNSVNNISYFTMTGGTINLPTSASTSSNSLAPFDISSNGSVVNISGGTIIIHREGGTGSSDLGYKIKNVINSNVTGGTLQIGGSSPSTQTMTIDSDLPIGNLVVNQTNSTAFLAQATTILNDVTIQTGTLNLNNMTLNVGGDWLNNNAVFIPGTGTVVFNGSIPQTITNVLGTETFRNITFASTNTVTLISNLNVTGNLSISSGSTFDVNSTNKSVSIQGNWTNNGTFTQRNGVVSFNGTTAQQMAGTATTRFWDLTTLNAAGVSITSGTYEIEDAYTPSSGNFNVTGATSFTLLSTATRTARIGQAGTATVTGNMNIQRYISTRAAGYTDMASPVTATTFADWDNELLLVYAYAPPDYYPSAWSYDEAIWDYVPVTAATQALSPGQGFEVYLDSDGSYTSFNAGIIDSRGVPNIGSVNVSSSLTAVNDGWNLIGNPYASFISWSSLLSGSTGIGSSIMIYDEAIADFEVLSGAVEIAPHQGFWVQATSGAPSLIFTEARKTTTTNSTFRVATPANFALRLESLQRTGFFTSKTQFVSQDDQKYEADVPFRGLPHPLAPDLYSMSEDKIFRIKKFNSSHDELEIQLGFQVGEDGLYSITPLFIQEMKDLGYSCVMLEDAKRGLSFSLNDEKPYKFYAETTDDVKRFTLHLSRNGECTKETVQPQEVVFMNGENKVNVQVLTGEHEGTISVFNLMGQPVSEPLKFAADGTYSVNVPLTAACYLINVSVNGYTYTHKYISR